MADAVEAAALGSEAADTSRDLDVSQTASKKKEKTKPGKTVVDDGCDEKTCAAGGLNNLAERDLPTRGGDAERDETLFAAEADVDGIVAESPQSVAASDGSPAAVKTLSERGAAFSVCSAATRCTTLHVAAYFGRVEVIRTLCAAGVEVDRLDHDDMPALHGAASRGFSAVVTTLLECGADVTRCCGWKLCTALHMAAHYEHVAVVRLLCRAGADVDRADADGFTALHVAVMRGSAEVATVLVNSGADVHGFSCEGRAPLHDAALNGFVELVRLLCAAGADVGRSDAEGNTALHLAARSDHGAEVASALLDAAANKLCLGRDGCTPLHEAGRYGCVELARLLCSAGVEVDVVDARGETAMHYCMHCGDTAATAAVLIEFGADVNRRCRMMKNTPLHLAAAEGYPELVRLLCGAGARVDEGDVHGLSPLYDAARGGNAAAAKALLECGADVNRSVEHVTQEPCTALSMAAVRGHAEVVGILLLAGASVDYVSSVGVTALFYAAQHGCTKTAMALLAYGADKDFSGPEGVTPLVVAASAGHVGFVRLLCAAGANVNGADTSGKTPLCMAAMRADNTAVVTVLLEARADVDRGDGLEDLTALHWAALKGGVESTLALCAAGAKVDRRSAKGVTALHYAVLKGHAKVVRVLLEHGAKMSIASRHGGEFPLHSAASTGQVELARVLCSAGAEVDRRDSQGSAALHRAAALGHTDVARVLLQHGADKNASQSDGATPLHQAALLDRVELARMLCSAGAELESVTNDGSTVLHIASEGDCHELVKALCVAGAQVDRTDARGRTALHRAVIFDQAKVVQVLLDHGASKNCRATCDDRAPLDEAVLVGSVEIARMLCAAGAQVDRGFANGLTAPCNSVREGHAKDARDLLEHGAQTNMAHCDDRGSLLHVAVILGRGELAGVLCLAGAEVDRRNSRGSTALHLAAMRGHTDVARVLLQHGADINASESDGATPLYQAVLQDRVELARMLCSAGAELESITNDSSTVLHIASGGHCHEVVRVLCAAGAQVDRADSKGLTALHHAVLTGNAEVARVLLEHGAKTNIAFSNSFGDTPLGHAAMMGHVALARVFCLAGVEIDRRDSRGSTALHTALVQGHIDVARVLLHHGADKNTSRLSDGATPLHLAVQSIGSSVESARMLCSMGAQVDRANVRGLTALHIAAICDAAEVMRVLVGHGANVNVSAAGSNRTTPLHEAVTRSSVECTRILCLAGADLLQANDNGGLTALHIALTVGFDEGIRILLEHGADLNLCDSTNLARTPLYAAAEQGGVEAIRLLCAGGADTAILNAEGQSPLARASVDSHVEAIAALCEHGADPNVSITADSLVTPLTFAAYQGRADVAAALLHGGACPELPGPEGLTALFRAAEWNKPAVVEELVRAGANTEARPSGYGYDTPLQRACRKTHAESVIALVQGGADETARIEVLPQRARGGICSVPVVTAIDVVGFGSFNGNEDPNQRDVDETDDEFATRRDATAIALIREVLAQATRDRLWKRRGWLVVLRARLEKTKNRGKSCNAGGKMMRWTPARTVAGLHGYNGDELTDEEQVEDAADLRVLTRKRKEDKISTGAAESPSNRESTLATPAAEQRGEVTVEATGERVGSPSEMARRGGAGSDTEEHMFGVGMSTDDDGCGGSSGGGGGGDGSTSTALLRVVVERLLHFARVEEGVFRQVAFFL